MRFLKIHTAPEQYLAEFYRRNSRLATATFDEQIAGLAQDGESAGPFWTPYLGELGYEAHAVIANCSQAQLQWAREHNISDSTPEKWVWEITRSQVETLQPDILCLDLDHALNFDSRFVKSLSWKPKLVMGWHNASIPLETDLSSFDVVLSGSTLGLEQALKSGAGAAEYFHPGFPSFLAAACKDEPETWDVVFSGEWRRGYARRDEFLLEVAKAPLSWRGEFSTGFFIACSQPEKLPAGIAMHNQGRRWGVEKYRALKSGQIVINPGELNESPSPLLFEATGMGVFLLTEHHPNVSLFFEPGVEIETFHDAQELIEKIYYYLEHAEQRSAIARRGQERCLKEYSRQIQAKELDRLIREGLYRKSCSASASDKKSIEQILREAVERLNGHDDESASRHFGDAIAARPDMPQIRYGQALALARLGRMDEALLQLRKLLLVQPDHPKARFLFEEIRQLCLGNPKRERLSGHASDANLLYQPVSLEEVLEKPKTPSGAESFVASLSLDSVKAGQCIKAKGRMREDGTLLALEISLEPPSIKAAIDGVVQSMDLQKNAIRLFNREFVLAADIEITDLQDDIIELGQLKPGDRVKVKGKYGDLKKFAPEKIKMKKIAEPDEVELTGRIDNMNSEKKTLEVLEITVTINEDTEFH